MQPVYQYCDSDAVGPTRVDARSKQTTTLATSLVLSRLATGTRREKQVTCTVLSNTALTSYSRHLRTCTAPTRTHAVAQHARVPHQRPERCLAHLDSLRRLVHRSHPRKRTTRDHGRHGLDSTCLDRRRGVGQDHALRRKGTRLDRPTASAANRRRQQRRSEWVSYERWEEQKILLLESLVLYRRGLRHALLAIFARPHDLARGSRIPDGEVGRGADAKHATSSHSGVFLSVLDHYTNLGVYVVSLAPAIALPPPPGLTRPCRSLTYSRWPSYSPWRGCRSPSTRTRLVSLPPRSRCACWTDC